MAITVCFKGITTVRIIQMAQATKDMILIFRIVNGLQQTNQLGHNKHAYYLWIIQHINIVKFQERKMGFYAVIKKSLEKAEASIKDLEEITRFANAMITEQAKRSLKMRNFFTVDPRQLNPATQHLFNQHHSKQYDEYSQLLTKQFAHKIVQKISGLQDLRVKQLGQIRNKVKVAQSKDKNEQDKKAQEQVQQFLQQLQKKVEQKKKQLQKVFKKQLNLMCNYRMDITAKQIQRWSVGLQSPFNEDEVKKQVQDVFK